MYNSTANAMHQVGANGRGVCFNAAQASRSCVVSGATDDEVDGILGKSHSCLCNCVHVSTDYI